MLHELILYVRNYANQLLVCVNIKRFFTVLYNFAHS